MKFLFVPVSIIWY